MNSPLEQEDGEWIEHPSTPQSFNAPSAIPIISLWGRLLVPLQGDIRDTQLQELEERLLNTIRDHGAEGLVIDASGVTMLDSHLCATLGRTAAAARLMGVRAVLCGLDPTVAMTLEAMGLALEHVETALVLESALDQLGVRVVRDEGEDEMEEGL
ncbi:MAG: STAS domain-containing protein [Polyangiaceae bacterium]|nr:STAS domain-containing protein [Polyangiaceae bacterium]